MITSSMKYKEMYDNLAEDLNKVMYKRDYYLPKVIKEFRKARQFPVWKWYQYTVQETKNDYVIYYYAEDARFVEKPKVGSFVNVFWNNQRYVIKWGATAYHHTPTSPIKAIRLINAYTSHFLHRYNERFLKNDNLFTNDIACIFLSRNEIPMQIKINDEINKNIEKYGEGAKQGFLVRDGFCFTNTDIEGIYDADGDPEKDIIDAILVMYTTFVTEKILTEGQRNAITKEYWDKWKQLYLKFEKEANNGVLELKLEP